MKKPNFGWFFFRFEIYQKISKITNFQNSLEKPHRVLWCCTTVHSKGCLSLLNFKIKKRRSAIFNLSNPPMIEVQYGDFGAHMSSYEPRNRHIVPQSCADMMGWKRWNVFFFILKLSNGKKPSECFTAPEDTMRLL